MVYEHVKRLYQISSKKLHTMTIISWARVCLMILFIHIGVFFLFSQHVLAVGRHLNIYNWSDYIADDTVGNFFKKSGIKTRYDVYDSNDILQAKLLAGRSGYDVVMPSSHYVGRLMNMKSTSGQGLFQTLDKEKLPNIKYLDSNLMKKVAALDPGNNYTVPWSFGTTGLGYNVETVQKILGENAPLDTWDNLFNPEKISALHVCKVSVLDAPDQLFAVALHYIGRNPASNNPVDYYDAFEVMKKIRPYITQFNSSTYINDLVGGDVCFAFGFSGDITIAGERAKKAKKREHIKYFIPRSGAPIWFDLMVIPSDAKNVNEALEWINYSQDPKVNAATTNKVFYPSANKAARQFVRSDIANNPNIYPSEKMIERLFPLTTVNPEVTRLMNLLWMRFKANKW